MRAFNFSFLAVLSYVAVIGATPLGARAPAEAIGRHLLSGCYPDDYPICMRCKEDPSEAICVYRCMVHPEYSFCSEICEIDDRWAFCHMDSSTSDQSPLQLCLT